MPLNVAGKQLSNGALAVAGGLIVGIVDIFLGWLFFLVLLVGVALFVVRTFPASPVPNA